MPAVCICAYVRLFSVCVRGSRSSSGQEWQLFIMSKTDLTNPQLLPWNVKTKGERVGC